jgi:hypothetical protein
MDDHLEDTYFLFCFSGKPLPVSGHARRGAEAHSPVALDADAHFSAAMIATGCDQVRRREQSRHWGDYLLVSIVSGTGPVANAPDYPTVQVASPFLSCDLLLAN